MIESKQQVLDAFFQAARSYLADPNAVSGIDFDDATVTLKRYVLTTMQDMELASMLARFQKLIRASDSTPVWPMAPAIVSAWLRGRSSATG